MSSHHFVKEGQEPALLIIDPLSHELIGPLLEWAPLVIVFDHAIDQVQHWGIKIDVVVAITDSAEDLTSRLDHQGPLKILSCSPKEDPLEKCLHFLKETNQASLNIITDNPLQIIGAIDHYRCQMDVSVLTEVIRWSSIISGKFRKWVPAHSRFQIIGANDFTILLNDAQNGFNDHKNESKHHEIDIHKDGIVAISSGSAFWIGENLQ